MECQNSRHQVSTISNESISTLDDAFRAAKEILCDKISKGFFEGNQGMFRL
jgi:hypothetical protein